jgi:hypothetical protein
MLCPGTGANLRKELLRRGRWSCPTVRTHEALSLRTGLAAVIISFPERMGELPPSLLFTVDVDAES